jgi:hypothetical protein
MADYEDGEVVDPKTDDLDSKTLQAIQYAVRGYSETSPAKPPAELTEYRRGKHDAFSAVRALLSGWIEEIEEDSEHNRD